MLNGLEENLKNAIEFAGGTIPDNSCVWEYPQIIREQLTGGGSINLIPGNGISMEKDADGNIVISSKSATSEGIIIDAIDAPEFSGLSTWPEGTSLQNLLEDLFYKVIPKIPSIIKGDVIITDENGMDRYAPEVDAYTDSLSANTPYLRIFLTSQNTPIYISLEKLVGIGGSGVVDLSNYYTINQIDNKFREVYDILDNITPDVPSVDLSDYYNKTEVDTILEDALKNIEIPEVNLDNYYSKSETDAIIKDSIKSIEIQPEDQEKEPVTIVDVVEKVIEQETQVQQIEQTIQNQTEQIVEVVEKVNNIDNTIVQKVQEETATEEEAHESFTSIFENK